jgi:GTPase Era involved in 16S rRNA processing
VEHGNEFLMVNRALKAIRRSDVVLLVIDVVAGITDQDKILAQRVAEDGRYGLGCSRKQQLMRVGVRGGGWIGRQAGV